MAHSGTTTIGQLEENKAVIEGLIDVVWNGGELQEMERFVDENVVFHDAPIPDLPRGVNGARRIPAFWRSVFSDAHIRNDDILAEGELVVHRFTFTGTQDHELYDIPPTNKTVTMSGINVFRLQNRRVVERWGVADVVGMMQQLGVIPPPPGVEPRQLAALASAPTEVGEELTTSEELQANKAVYRRFVDEVVNKGNFHLIPELYHPDYRDHSAVPGLPGGLDGVAATMGMFRSAFPDVHFGIQNIAADGDRVGTHVIGTGTNDGPFLGRPPSGKRAAWESMGIFRVRDGKIVEHWGNPDLFALLQQIGVIPSPGGATQ